jgi:general stress protein CsbA
MLIAAGIILPATLIVGLAIHLVGLIAFGAVMFFFCMLVVLMTKIDGETAREIGEVARVAVPAAASAYVGYRMARHVATGIGRDGVREAMED